MEILVYKSNIEKDYQTITLIDWGSFDKQIKKRPEDYVFILSSDEWNKLIQLNKQLYAISKGKKNLIKEDEYTSKYQGVFVITELALQPDFLKSYKIGSFNHKILGTTYAVFYINRSKNEVERSNEVLKRIIDYKSNEIRDDNKRN